MLSGVRRATIRSFLLGTVLVCIACGAPARQGIGSSEVFDFRQRKAPLFSVRQGPEGCGAVKCCGCAPFFVRCSIAAPCPGEPADSVFETETAGHCCSSSAEGAIAPSSPGSAPSPSSFPSTTTQSPSRGNATSPASTTPAVLTTSAEEESNTCLHTELLNRIKVPPEALVHRKHIWSRMLCLEADPIACATPDHKVYVHDKELPMKTACESFVRCEARYGYVNNMLSHLATDGGIAAGGVIFSHYDYNYPEWVQRVTHRVLSLLR